jgi:hypothetical protein
MKGSFELGESPILVGRGDDLVVQYAYKTGDGRWHEIVVSNGSDLSSSEQNGFALARKIQHIWASCMGGVVAQFTDLKIEPSQVGFLYEETKTDVWIVKEAGKTAHDFLEEKLDEYRTENERATFLLGSLINLPESISADGIAIDTVHKAMAYLDYSLRPHRVEHGPIKMESGETGDANIQKLYQFINTKIRPEVIRILDQRAEAKQFPFTKDWSCKGIDFLSKWDEVPELEKGRIRAKILEHLKKPDEEVISLFKELDKIEEKNDQVRKIGVQFLLNWLGFYFNEPDFEKLSNSFFGIQHNV